MRIDQKQYEREFNKLKQLDRIEFRQRRDFIITRNEPPSLLWVSFGILFMAMLTFYVAFLGAEYYGDEWFLTFISIAKNLMFGSAYTLGLNLLVLLYHRRKISKELAGLYKEYMPDLIIL